MFVDRLPVVDLQDDWEGWIAHILTSSLRTKGRILDKENTKGRVTSNMISWSMSSGFRPQTRRIMEERAVHVVHQYRTTNTEDLR